ncbi:MAG: putative quinol monooxygenase [Candidatus Hydrogenedentota bacterium]
MAITRRDFVAALICSGAGAAAFAAGSGEKQESADGGHPVYVVAAIEVKPGKRAAFIEIFKDNVPKVHAEDGCHFYEPVVDFETGIGAQAPLRDNVMTVVEKWSSLDALKAHLDAPHMNSYREQVADLVAGVTLHIMRPA